MKRNLVKPNGWASPSRETMNKMELFGLSDSIAERKVFCMPYYTWCNDVNGHTVEMAAIEERMAGCMNKSTHVVVYVDGALKYTLGLDGKTSEIADYLRGGHYDGVGASLEEHKDITNGKDTLPYTYPVPMPKLLQDLCN